MTPTKPENRGHFRKGFDPRRHRFTREECQAGYWAVLTAIITRYPGAVDSSGRHMACDFLHAAGVARVRKIYAPCRVAARTPSIYHRS
jgi:hypothetical protein